MASNQIPKLEVPSKEFQSIRKEALVEKLLNGDKSMGKTTSQSSDILNQVKAFMPMMKAANEQLETIDKSSLQLDAEPGEGDAYVEMNLQLFEENSGTSDSDSDSTDSTSSPDPSSESESDSDEEARIPMKQQKLIEEIDTKHSNDTESTDSS